MITIMKIFSFIIQLKDSKTTFNQRQSFNEQSIKCKQLRCKNLFEILIRLILYFFFYIFTIL